MKSVLITCHHTSTGPDVRRHGIVRCSDAFDLASLGNLIGRTSKDGALTIKGISLDTKGPEVSSTYDFVGFKVLF